MQIRICDICGKRISRFYPVVIKPPKVPPYEEQEHRNFDYSMEICMECYGDIYTYVVKLKSKNNEQENQEKA